MPAADLLVDLVVEEFQQHDGAFVSGKSYNPDPVTRVPTNYRPSDASTRSASAAGVLSAVSDESSASIVVLPRRSLKTDAFFNAAAKSMQFPDQIMLSRKNGFSRI